MILGLIGRHLDALNDIRCTYDMDGECGCFSVLVHGVFVCNEWVQISSHVDAISGSPTSYSELI